MKTIRQLKKERDPMLMWDSVSEQAEKNRRKRLEKEKRRTVRIGVFHAKFGVDVNAM